MKITPGNHRLQVRRIALTATVMGLLGTGCVATRLQLAPDHPVRAAAAAGEEPTALLRGGATETPSEQDSAPHHHPAAPAATPEHVHPAPGPAEAHDAH